MPQKSLLERSRGALGGFWRPIPKKEGGARFFWTLLGPSWPSLGPSWRPLGAVLAVLTASWARLVPVLAAKIGPKVDSTSMQKSIIFLMLFEIGFLMDFGRFGEPKWSQVGTKIGSKFDINFEERFLKNRALAAAGARFLRIGGSKLGPKINQKSITKWNRKWSAQSAGSGAQQEPETAAGNVSGAQQEPGTAAGNVSGAQQEPETAAGADSGAQQDPGTAAQAGSGALQRQGQQRR